jgi:hypothetical protein
MGMTSLSSHVGMTATRTPLIVERPGALLTRVLTRVRFELAVEPARYPLRRRALGSRRALAPTSLASRRWRAMARCGSDAAGA